MKTIIANWKMNPTTHKEAKALCEATIKQATKYKSVNTIICPPFLALSDCAALAAVIPNVSIGGQNMFWEQSGPYTGEISPLFLKDSGAKYALIGHSDRRYILHETDDMLNRKIKAALVADLIPILFIGEQEPGSAREDILIDQLSRDLAGLSAEQVSKLIIVYEPVWAISTSQNAQADTPENTLTSLGLIKSILNRLHPILFPLPLMLYGGSVNQDNARDFLAHAEVGGAVVGGASLRPEEFGKILEIADTIAS